MPDFIERVKDRIKDPSRDFKERVFIVLNLIIDFLVLCALIGDIVFHESIVEIVMLSLIVVLTPTITLVSVKLNRTNFAIIFNVIALVFVTIPVVFYFGGGLYGGAYPRRGGRGRLFPRGRLLRHRRFRRGAAGEMVSAVPKGERADFGREKQGNEQGGK